MVEPAGVQLSGDLAERVTREDLVVTEVRLDLGDDETGDPARPVKLVRQA